MRYHVRLIKASVALLPVIGISAVAQTEKAGADQSRPKVVASEATKPRPLAYSVTDKRLKWQPCPDFLPKGCEIAVLHGDPAKPNADIFFKAPPKSYLASHRHTSAERMVLVQGEMIVTYDGQDPVTLQRGMYAYGPAQHVHEAQCVSVDPCVLFIAFEQPIDATPTPMAFATPAPTRTTPVTKPAATSEKKPKKGGC